MGTTVLSLLEQDHEKIRQLQDQRDTIGLYNLIKEIVKSGKTDCFDIKAQLSDVKQSREEIGLEGLSKFVQKLDAKFSLINGTAAEVKHDEEKCNILLRALISNRYSDIIMNYYEKRIVYKDNISIYQQVKNMLIAHERTLIRIEPENTNDPPAALAATIGDRSNNFYNSFNRPINNHCNNCDKEGHRAHECHKSKHRCTKCQIFGHLEKYCKRVKTANANFASQKFNKKYKERKQKQNKEDSDDQQKKKRQNIANVATAHQPSYDAIDEDSFAFLTQIKRPSAYNVLKRRKITENGQNQDQFILDSGASIHVFNSVIGLTNHRSPPKSYKLNGLGGVQSTVDYIGHIPFIGDYNVMLSQPINLLSINELVKYGFEISYGETCTLSYKGNFIDFVQTNTNNLSMINRDTFNKMVSVSRKGTVYNVNNQSNSQYTKEQYIIAKEVRHLHLMLHHPSDSKLSNALKYGAIAGSRLTQTDIQLSNDILGPCVDCMIGKSTKPHYTQSKSIPASKVGEVLHVDLYPLSSTSIGGSKFLLVSVCEYSSYLSIIPLSSKSGSAIIHAFKQLISKYNAYGHKVTAIQCDSENNLLSTDIELGSLSIQLRPVPPYQHAQRMERYVRTINNGCRSTLSGLPYHLPAYLTIELLNSVIRSLNAIPNSTHIIPSESPQMQMTGRKYDINYHLQIPFGAVVMCTDIAGKTPAPNKINDERAELGIALGPSQNSYNSISVFIFGKVGTAGGPIRTRSKVKVLKQLPDQFEWTIKRIHQPNNGGEQPDIITSKYHFLTLDEDTPTVTSSDSKESTSKVNELMQNTADVSLQSNTSNSNDATPTLPLKRKLSEEKTPEIRKMVENQSNNSISHHGKDADSGNLEKDSTNTLSNQTSGNHSEITPDCNAVTTNENKNALAECIPTKESQSVQGIHPMSTTELSSVKSQTDRGSDQSDVSLTHQFPEKGEMNSSSDIGSRQETDDMMADQSPSEQSIVSEMHVYDSFEKHDDDLIEMHVDDSTEMNDVTPEQTETKILTNSRKSGRKRIPNTKLSEAEWTNESEWRAAYHITIKKALSGEYALQSKQAIMDEIKNMLDYKVGYYTKYNEIPKRFCQKNIIRALMFLKHKVKPD